MSHEPTLREVIEELTKRGQPMEAFSYELYFSMMALQHDMSEDEIMRLSIDEAIALASQPPIPLKYRGWDNFYWGRAKFAGDNR